MPFGGSGFAGEGPGVDAVRPKRDAVTLRSRGDPRLGMAGEWACRLGALPPMCMTHHGPDPTGIDRIQGCGAIDRTSGELPSDHQLDTDKGIGHRGKFRKPAPRARASQRCEIQAALRRRAAPLTPYAHAVNPIAATDEERPLRFEQKTGSENLAGCGKSRSVLFSEQSVPLSVAATH